MLIGAREWLATLARLLRGGDAAVDAPPRWMFWLGVASLLAASCSLEWSRLYQWEALLPGRHAGGAIGATLGAFGLQALGFAGSGVTWIAALVVGMSLALRFSWARVAERIGAVRVIAHEAAGTHRDAPKTSGSARWR